MTRNLSTISKKLTENYPNSFRDFHGSGTPCIFKTGPSWDIRIGHQGHELNIQRVPRPIHHHPIAKYWRSLGVSIVEVLDTANIHWNFITPVAYACDEESTPFCPFLITIGVRPQSLIYDKAVDVAATIKKDILHAATVDTIEVAFIESQYTRQGPIGPKLPSFDPPFETNLRKPFSPILGVSIASAQYPRYEGIGALFYRMGACDQQIALLTCAHVARPIAVHSNTGITCKNSRQQREEVVILGNASFHNSVTQIKLAINEAISTISAHTARLLSMEKPSANETVQGRKQRKWLEKSIKNAKDQAEEHNTLHTEITKYYSLVAERSIGHILHTEKIEANTAPYGYTKDWALVQLYPEKFNWTTFKGNKIYYGDKYTMNQFRSTMFPQVGDNPKYPIDTDGFLRIREIVPEAEIKYPRYVDKNNGPALLVLKNGSTTGTTIGRVNGLESFIRTIDDNGSKCTSLEIAVFRHEMSHGSFSEPGDSGSAVVDRDGRLVGMLTGGAGLTNGTDVSYITPYWWLEQQIKAKFPDGVLYDTIEQNQ